MQNRSLLLLITGISLYSCKKELNNSMPTEAETQTTNATASLKPLVFGAGDKTMDILDALSGEKLLHSNALYAAGPVSIYKTPLFTGSFIILPCGNRIICANYQTNQPRWEVFLKSSDSGYNFKNTEMCMNASTVFMAYADYLVPEGTTKHISKLVAIDVVTGKIKWTVNLFDFAVNGDQFSNPVCTEQTVYLPVEHQLVAFNAQTGIVQWNFRALGNTAASLVNPAYTGDRIFVSSGTDSLFSVNRNTGARMWARQLPSSGGNPAVVPYKGKLYINCNQKTAPYTGGILCVDAGSGATVWQFTRPSSFPYTMEMCPAFAENDVVYASELGHARVYAFNATTGDTVWTKTITDIVSTSQNEGPVVYNGRVYFKTSGAVMKCLNGATGNTIWSKVLNAGSVINPDFGAVVRAADGSFLYASETGMQQ